MGEVNGWVTHTALAIRDEDELEVAASLLDAALRRAKAEGMREAAIRAREFSRPYSMEWWMTLSKREISAVMCRDVADALDARAAQIEEGE